jgi:hypothetical protein
MEAARISETSVDNYFTRQYIPEDNSELHTRRRENLKSLKKLAIRQWPINIFLIYGNQIIANSVRRSSLPPGFSKLHVIPRCLLRKNTFLLERETLESYWYFLFRKLLMGLGVSRKLLQRPVSYIKYGADWIIQPVYCLITDWTTRRSRFHSGIFL